MYTRLSLLDDEVRLHEARLADARVQVESGARRTTAAFKRRLARADSLAAAGGAGVLYGLWVTRTCGNETTAGGTAAALPPWLVRLALSSAVSWWLSSTGAPATEATEPDAALG